MRIPDIRYINRSEAGMGIHVTATYTTPKRLSTTSEVPFVRYVLDGELRGIPRPLMPMPHKKCAWTSRCHTLAELVEEGSYPHYWLKLRWGAQRRASKRWRIRREAQVIIDRHRANWDKYVGYLKVFEKDSNVTIGWHKESRTLFLSRELKYPELIEVLRSEYVNWPMMSGNEWRFFDFYLKMGARRDLRTVAKAFGYPLDYIESLAEEYGWQDRARDYDVEGGNRPYGQDITIPNDALKIPSAFQSIRDQDSIDF